MLGASLLNLTQSSRDPHLRGLRGPEEVLMTKHRTITGLVAVALLAVAATTATMRSHSPWTDGTTGLKVDANKPADFENRWSAMFALLPTTDTAQPGLDVR
jgi:hypothetical protein